VRISDDTGRRNFRLKEFLKSIERFPNDDTFRCELDREGVKAILAAIRSAENDALERAAPGLRYGMHSLVLIEAAEICARACPRTQRNAEGSGGNDKDKSPSNGPRRYHPSDIGSCGKAIEQLDGNELYRKAWKAGAQAIRSLYSK